MALCFSDEASSGLGLLGFQRDHPAIARSGFTRSLSHSSLARTGSTGRGLVEDPRSGEHRDVSIQSRRVLTPSPDEVGAKGAWFFGDNNRRHGVRHVQTVALRTDRLARLQLTVDLLLPGEAPVAVSAAAGQHDFIVPLVLIDKWPPVTHFDLHDEADRTIPLLTRAEAAETTISALLKRAHQLAGDVELPDEVLNIVRAAVVQESELARTHLLWLDDLVRENPPWYRARASAWDDLRSLLEELARGWLLWIPLSGRLGERRSIQLAFDLAPTHPPLRPSRAYVEPIVLETGKSAVHFELNHPGDEDPRSFLQRLVTQAGVLLGVCHIDYWLDLPYASGCASYHLQVTTPEGLEVRDIRVAGRLENPEGEELPSPEATRSQKGGHLYLPPGVQAESSAKAVITLRVGRRGFLTWAALCSWLVAGILWAFAARWADADGPSAHEGVAAAVLLVTPALLLGFVVRPQENALATRLLSGVRACVLAVGLCSVLSAAALAGVRLQHVDVAASLKLYAIIATAIAGWLTAARVRSLDSRTDRPARLRREWRQRALVIAGIASTVVFLIYGVQYPDRVDEIVPVMVSILAASAFAFGYHATQLASLIGAGHFLLVMALAGAFVCGAALLALMGASPWGTNWDAAWEVYAWAFAGTFGVLLLLEVGRLTGGRQRAEGGASL